MSKENIQLYLDLSSSNTGVVIYKEGSQEVLLDSINLKKLQKPPLMKQVDYEKVKIGCIKNYLDSINTLYNIKKIYCEGIFINRTFLKSSEILLKIHGFLMGYFLDKKVYFIPPANIKKEITEKGNAKKEEVRRVLERHYHYQFRNDDETDAFALFIYKNGHQNWLIKEVERYGNVK